MASEGPLGAQVVIVEKRVGSAAGFASILFGILGIFTLGLLFVPLAFLFAIIALFKRQIALGLVGLILAVIAAITSPSLWAVFGLGALYVYW